MPSPPSSSQIWSALSVPGCLLSDADARPAMPGACVLAGGVAWAVDSDAGVGALFAAAASPSPGYNLNTTLWTCAIPNGIPAGVAALRAQLATNASIKVVGCVFYAATSGVAASSASPSPVPPASTTNCTASLCVRSQATPIRPPWKAATALTALVAAYALQRA
ncbi:uncharacterized protein LOC62_01G000612 [Vanrija pseudolonga]|uniref:Uncharacterized protein n=1 Tax=Vanrija pseudolonga TaxID=143232 RepID=A0AAF0Y3N6_9TREE|nr:hypothetical protein LOC62_01G000612 [Vanrija pseudolonga]